MSVVAGASDVSIAMAKKTLKTTAPTFKHAHRFDGVVHRQGVIALTDGCGFTATFSDGAQVTFDCDVDIPPEDVAKVKVGATVHNCFTKHPSRDVSAAKLFETRVV